MRSVRLLPAAAGVLLTLTAPAGPPPAGAAAPPTPLGTVGPEVPQPAPRLASGSWAGFLTAHPRLQGSRAFLQALAQSKPAEYRALRAETEEREAAAVVHAVEGLPEAEVARWITAAQALVAAGPTNTHQDTWVALTAVAETYDAFYDRIDPADRRRMLDYLNAHLATFTADEDAFHNSTLSKTLCYLKVAYATWGDSPQAPAFRDRALRELYERKLAPVLRAFGAGGGYTECGWYQRSSLWHLVLALELARRFEGYDGFQQAPRFFYQRMAYELLQPYPGLFASMYGAQQYAMEGDGSNIYGEHVEYPRLMRNLLAQYFRGSELSRYLANGRRPGSNGWTRLMDFLYEEEPDSALPLRDFPLSHIATGVGKVYARGDWSDAASWLRFECGPYWNGHQHFEVGNFEIFRHETLATESGEYTNYLSNHDVNWLTRTIAHNALLVYLPGEQWTVMRDGGRNPYANDGGQTKKWDWTRASLEEWEQTRSQFERGSIVAYRDEPPFLYLAADCTLAYSPRKLAKWIRQIVFLRPHTFVIFDRVVSTRPEYQKTWLLHSRFEPQLTGPTILIRNGEGTLHVQALLPERPLLRTVEGYTYGGLTFPPDHQGALSAVANRWRLELQPSRPQREDLFLTVLSTDGAPEARLIRAGAAVGAELGSTRVLFQGDTGGSLTLAGRSTPLRAGVVTNRFQ